MPLLGRETCESICENMHVIQRVIFCSRPSQKGSGSIPDLTSQSTLHAFLQRVNVM